MRRGEGSRNRFPRRAPAAVLAAAAVLMLQACSGGGSSSTSHSVLTIDAFAPLSGAEAVFGPESTSGCLTALQAINGSGGILGHRVQCVATDSRSDAADAVPAAQQMLATSSNLIAIVGPSTNESPSTVGIFNKAHIPMVAQTGDPIYDHTTDAYFWRPTPADDINGIAMALWAYKQKGYTRAASVFGNDVAGQGVVPNLVRAFTRLGGTVVDNEKLALDQNSYRTEVERLIAAQPQVIFTELDPQTAATFFGEVKELHGPIPVVGDGGTIGYPAWLQAVSGAIGAKAMAQDYSGVQIINPTGGVGWQTFQSNLMKIHIKGGPSQFLHDPYTTSNYDTLIDIALAMNETKSTNPTVYNKDIIHVANGGAGRVVVHTYPEGVNDIKNGKKVQFVGAVGPLIFDQYHNASLPWEVDTVTAGLQIVRQGVVAANEVAALET